MDKSKLPEMVKGAIDIVFGDKPKKRSGKKKNTNPGAVDDNAMKRVKKKRKMLEETMKYK